METRIQKGLMLFGLGCSGAFLSISAAYRNKLGATGIAGIRLASTEGEPGYGHHLAFHSDEFISLPGAVFTYFSHDHFDLVYRQAMNERDVRDHLRQQLGMPLDDLIAQVIAPLKGDAQRLGLVGRT